jgi:hypothetical protein
MGEMRSLLNTNVAATEMPELLAAWNREAQSGIDVLVGPAQEGDEDAHATMAEFTADQSEGLTALVEELPKGEAQLIAKQTLAYIQGIGSSLGASDAGSPGTDGLFPNPAGSPSAGENASSTTSPTPTVGTGGTGGFPTPSGTGLPDDLFGGVSPSAPTPQIPGGQPIAPAPTAPDGAEPTISAPPFPLPTGAAGPLVGGHLTTQGLGTGEQPTG